jgi:hypothetical protein
VFSHSKARWLAAAPSKTTPIRPALAESFRIPAQAIRPLAMVVGCAAAIAIAGCQPGINISTSSGATPSAGTSTATAGTAQTGSPTSAIAALAGNAPGVNSFVAKLDIHATGHLAADLSGTLTEQAQPDPIVEVQTTVPSGLEAILSGDTAYLKIGALTQTAGKPWIKASIGGLDSSAGASLAPIIQQLQAGNPLAQSQMFAAATNVREVGTATISGVPTTEYSGSYSLDAGLAKLPSGQRADFQSDMEASGITGTEFTVWANANHQVRKISLVELGKSTQIDIVLVIVSLNQPVQIQIPPASEVAGATGITTRPAPVATTPAPAMTSAPPAPSVTSTPAPVTTSQPTPLPTDQPTHW